MMSEEHEEMRNEMMKQKTYQKLVKKNMHDFTRRAKEQILKERLEKLEQSKEAN